MNVPTTLNQFQSIIGRAPKLSPKENASTTLNQVQHIIGRAPELAPTDPVFQPQSARSTPTPALQDIIQATARTTSQSKSTKVVITDQIRKDVLDQFTDPSKATIVLDFFESEIEFCPHDQAAKLDSFGTPSNSHIAALLTTFAERNNINSSKRLGTSLSKVFQRIGPLIWPKSFKKVKRKHRCLVGIRAQTTSPPGCIKSPRVINFGYSADAKGPATLEKTAYILTPQDKGQNTDFQWSWLVQNIL